MTNASRAQIDFEAFARDLQHPQPSHPRPTAVPGGGRAEPRIESRPETKSDPLAELARIVGQDDPFRALLEARDGRRGGESVPARRVEPSFVTEQVPAHQASAHSAAAQGTSPADAFDQYLATVDREYPAGPGYDGHETDVSGMEAQAAYGGRALKRAPRRRRLVSVGAGIAVVAISVTGALTWRSLHSGRIGGGVPLIQADTAPLKIAPKTADGVEIPDQNKQIYEPKAKDGQIRIVNREEQPLDVAQAARAAQGASGLSQGGQGTSESGTTPGGLTDAFGEPRRVRTVSVKPDTPPPPPAQREAAAAETATPSVIPTMTLPGSEEAAPARPRPSRQASALPTPAPTPTAPPPAAESTPVVAAPAPTRPKAPQRVASVAPETAAPVEAPTTTAATTAAPVGGFSVQLGVRTSAAEAQTAFRQMQGKYAQLAGQPELIRQAEVNGKTIWRVRVGPLGKNEATSLCSQLQAAGGQCFVAKN
ncbi:SPOR domain-containing protein [Methylobacterium segetis]|uniref:SPOR domain-containing protein n=1 Tax=Methylobacterium segetis TaxID=2488750 RepID=UPI00104A8751|nr:SPOR domain-containing protein [Methylobacterium segetis]